MWRGGRAGSPASTRAWRGRGNTAGKMPAATAGETPALLWGEAALLLAGGVARLHTGVAGPPGQA